MDKEQLCRLGEKETRAVTELFALDGGPGPATAALERGEALLTGALVRAILCHISTSSESPIEPLLPVLVSRTTASDLGGFDDVLRSYVGKRADRAARILAMIALEAGARSAGIVRVVEQCASLINPQF